MDKKNPNIADPEQVIEAGKKEKLKRQNEMIDLARVLETREGRNVIWRILSKCGVYKSVWRQSAEIHYLAGQQDLGHWLQSEIVNTDENYLFKMMTENKESLK